MTKKIQILCIEVLLFKKAVAPVEGAPLMDKSCGAFLVILNQVTKLYGPEMAPMALLHHPRYGGNHGDGCPKGPALGEDRLVEG